ncbi:MAG: glycosyltransferase, partial [Acidimicrobiales bacterium]
MAVFSATSRRPTICLAMIVKNESAVIERCLRAALGNFDSWVIVDTGSDDDTCERIEAILAGVPGRLEHRPWVDFGHNRTELMELAYEESADWLLLLDADIELEVDGNLHDLLPVGRRADAWLVDVVGSTVGYAMPYLVSGHRHWHYVGATHEYIDTGGRVVRERLTE